MSFVLMSGALCSVLTQAGLTDVSDSRPLGVFQFISRKKSDASNENQRKGFSKRGAGFLVWLMPSPHPVLLPS